MDALFHDVTPKDMQLLEPPWGPWGRSFTLGMVSGVAKLALTILNTFNVRNHQTYLDAVLHREQGVPLLTIANHTSMFDDPGVLCGLTPWSFFWTEPWHQKNRWTLCAKEVCFRNELLRQFFANGKTLPIVRGDGVHQPVMRLAARELAKGEWVHVFPEGRIHFSGQLGPFRWGAAKLVCDTRVATGRDPVVLPFYHSGMGEVLPMGAVVFRAGKTITVNIGKPLDLSDLTCDCGKAGKDQEKVWEAITARMFKELKALEDQSPKNVNQVPDKDPVTEGVADPHTAPA